MKKHRTSYVEHRTSIALSRFFTTASFPRRRESSLNTQLLDSRLRGNDVRALRSKFDVRRPMLDVRSRSGLTLAEVAISTLIVGLMMVASLKSVGGVYTTWTSAADKYDGITLADQLLEEIMQSEYEEPDVTVEFGPEIAEGNGIRANWDDVDDYVSWTHTPPSKKAGAAFPNYDGWTRTATVQLASVADPLTVPASDEGLKLITVTVTDPDGNVTTRQALRSRWGTLQQEPLVDSTWVTEVDIQLTTGSGASTTSAASIPNAAEDYGNGNGNGN